MPILLSVLALELIQPLPEHKFELYSQVTERLWKHRRTLSAVNAYSACEMWLGSIKGGSSVMDATYNVAVLPREETKTPNQLHEDTISERAFYLYCGYIRGRLPRHLRRFVRRGKR